MQSFCCALREPLIFFLGEEEGRMAKEAETSVPANGSGGHRGFCPKRQQSRRPPKAAECEGKKKKRSSPQARLGGGCARRAVKVVSLGLGVGSSLPTKQCAAANSNMNQPSSGRRESQAQFGSDTVSTRADGSKMEAAADVIWGKSGGGHICGASDMGGQKDAAWMRLRDLL